MSMIITKAVKAAVLAASVLPMAALAADLYGGGATFPAVPYVGADFQSYSAGSTRLSSSLGGTNAATVNAGSLFGAFIAASGNNMSYCQTGSGTGKSVLTAPTVPASGACGLFSQSPAGFSAPAAQPAYPNYIGTDSPISATDYNNFLNNFGSAHTALVQVPSIVGAVTLPMKLTAANGTPITRINLTTQQVCSIFSGAVKTWSGIDSSYPATPITVVYRSDGSGTSFAFTNFLARNCNVSGSTPIFLTNQTYSAAVNVGNYAMSSAQSGNFNVVNTARNTEGAIGYADPGDVDSTGADYANVEGFDPLSLVSPTIAPANLLVDTVLGSTNPSTGLPTTASAPSTGVTGGLTLVSPDTVISGAYPILAPTYLAFYASGNGSANSAALQSLVRYVHNRSGAPTPGRPTLPVGYAYLTGNAVVMARIDTALSRIGQ